MTIYEDFELQKKCREIILCARHELCESKFDGLLGSIKQYNYICSKCVGNMKT